MGRFFYYLSWVFLLVFLIPTALILASWNSLPGDRMYGVKRGFERLILAAAKPSYAAQSLLHIKYTERRFSEAKVLLAKDGSTEGLHELTSQVLSAEQAVLQAPNPKVQKELAAKYVVTLKSVSQQLEQQKAALTASGAIPPSPTRPPRSPTTPQSPGIGGGYLSPTPLPNNSASSLPIVPTAPPIAPTAPAEATTPQNPEDIAGSIDETQETIKKAIDDLEGASATGIQGTRPNDRGNDKDQNRGNNKESNGSSDRSRDGNQDHPGKDKQD